MSLTFVTPSNRSVRYERHGNGPPLLLLHGFPQTRAMWWPLIPKLSAEFTVIAADLRGYGESDVPETMQDMSFRAMADDMLALMSALGFSSFFVAGHDRGARAAHRLALDAPDQIAALAVMDIVPTQHLLAKLTQEVARAYYHWFFLAQPAPFPETMIAHDPDAYFEACLLGFGAADPSDFAAERLAHYRAAWRQPRRIHAMCNDYRAAIDVDVALDTADLARKVSAPTLVLYGADGAMARLLDVPATWSPRLERMSHQALPGGHFFPEQAPDQTAEALIAFFNAPQV